MTAVIDIAFHLGVILVIFFSVIRGYKRGFIRQIPVCIGLCFGVLCSYIFRFPAEEYVASILPWVKGNVEESFVAGTVACAAIYFIASSIFQICTLPLRYVLSVFDTGLMDNISGAIFNLLRMSLILSIVYNLILCFGTDCRLLKYARSDDGDIVHEVMLLAPFMLGSESVDELAHKVQLEEAKTIS